MRPCASRHPEPVESGCTFCKLYLTNPEFKVRWSEGYKPNPGVLLTPRTDCQHLGEPTGQVVGCSVCGGRQVSLPVHACKIYGTCLPGATRSRADYPVCNRCDDYRPTES